MADEDVVNVTTLRDHTIDGVPHAKGDVYDAPASALYTLISRGMAYPTTAMPDPPPVF